MGYGSKVRETTAKPRNMGSNPSIASHAVESAKVASVTVNH